MGGIIPECPGDFVGIRNKSCPMGNIVGKNDTCASSCFLIFAAGRSKAVYPHSRIGVHAASDDLDWKSKRSLRALIAAVRIARFLGGTLFSTSQNAHHAVQFNSLVGTLRAAKNGNSVPLVKRTACLLRHSVPAREIEVSPNFNCAIRVMCDTV